MAKIPDLELSLIPVITLPSSASLTCKSLPPCYSSLKNLVCEVEIPCSIKKKDLLEDLEKLRSSGEFFSVLLEEDELASIENSLLSGSFLVKFSSPFPTKIEEVTDKLCCGSEFQGEYLWNWRESVEKENCMYGTPAIDGREDQPKKKEESRANPKTMSLRMLPMWGQLMILFFFFFTSERLSLLLNKSQLSQGSGIQMLWVKKAMPVCLSAHWKWKGLRLLCPSDAFKISSLNITGALLRYWFFSVWVLRPKRVHRCDSLSRYYSYPLRLLSNLLGILLLKTNIGLDISSKPLVSQLCLSVHGRSMLSRIRIKSRSTSRLKRIIATIICDGEL